MWRKIHSNRDPRDTVYSELRKEFGSYFDRAGDTAMRLTRRRPRVFFYGMIVCLVFSAGLSFTVLRQKEKKINTIARSQDRSPLQDGFGQLLEATARIKATLRLKHEVDRLTAKKNLNAQDSIALDAALTQLQRLRGR